MVSLPSVQQGDLTVAGALSCNTFNPPQACITDNAIGGSGATGISASKLITHFRLKDELFTPATTVAAIASKYLFTGKAAGSLVSFVGVITGSVPVGAYGFTVDLLKSTGGGAPASILTTKITATSASALLTALGSAIATASYNAGDSFFLTVALTGGSGTQAVGLGITLMVAEQFV